MQHDIIFNMVNWNNAVNYIVESAYTGEKCWSRAILLTSFISVCFTQITKILKSSDKIAIGSLIAKVLDLKPKSHIK